VRGTSHDLNRLLDGPDKREVNAERPKGVNQPVFSDSFLGRGLLTETGRRVKENIFLRRIRQFLCEYIKLRGIQKTRKTQLYDLFIIMRSRWLNGAPQLLADHANGHRLDRIHDCSGIPRKEATIDRV
jgi:hypothetical protein